MAHNLRQKTNINYAWLNDLPSDVIKTFNVKPKKLSWSPNAVFEVQILGRVGLYNLKVHFVGYSEEYDEMIPRTELILKLPPGAVNGPTTLNDFCDVLRFEILKELKSSKHALPEKCVQIETSNQVIQELEKAFGRDFTGLTSVEQI